MCYGCSMMEHGSTSYRQRMLAVLDHIQHNIDGDLGLPVLARVAGFSPFHFHRIFAGMTGETIGAHIRRLRLERAAQRLRFSAWSVAEVGLEAGYNAPEAFTRAFKSAFGDSPSQFREQTPARLQEYAATLLSSPETILDANPNAKGALPMDVTIKTKAAVRVAFARATGPYLSSAKEAWEKLAAWAAPKGLFVEDAQYLGLSHDDPSITPADKIRYDACVSVGPDVAPEGEIGISEIPGGDYAVMLHKGPYEGLEKSYYHLYGTWLPLSGREAAMRPPHEVFLNHPDTTPPEELLTEINVPLEGE